MDDLIAFLRARLDEDQATAERARDAEFCKDGRWNARGPFGDDDQLGSVQSEVNESILGEDADDVPFAFVDHIARHDPARVLAEIDAKRRIMECHEPWTASNGEIICGRCGREHIDGRPGGHFPCQTLRLLALPDAEHPDYREEWRP